MDIHDENGSATGQRAEHASTATDVFAEYGDEADAEIARIIAENAGREAAACGTPAQSDRCAAQAAAAKLMVEVAGGDITTRLSCNGIRLRRNSSALPRRSSGAQARARHRSRCRSPLS